MIFPQYRSGRADCHPSPWMGGLWQWGAVLTRTLRLPSSSARRSTVEINTQRGTVAHVAVLAVPPHLPSTKDAGGSKVAQDPAEVTILKHMVLIQPTC